MHNLWCNNFFRVSARILDDPDFKKRYAWYLSELLVLLIGIWGYGVLGSAFVNANPDYQWILAFVSPLIREMNFKLLYYVTLKAAGKEEALITSGNSIRILTQHYAYAKHAVFLAVTVGGVATSTTNYCIAGIDFLEAMFDCFKIIRKYNENQEIKGNLSSQLFILYSNSFQNFWSCTS